MKKKLKSAVALAAVIAAAPAAGAASEKAAAEKPVAYMVSDAHLDTQWNWDIQTTIGEYVWNTINQNLFLLKKYPDYVFNFEGGVKYSWMKEYYPLQYEEMKQFIKDGRWHLSGASWDANDAIVPSPEAFIRNILLGQTFYRNEFGVESTDIFLPDCFGFGWTLPTIASHCGLIGFSSQKLGWRHLPFHGDKKYPFSVGLWQGVDGSRIMMTHGFNYGQRYDLQDLSQNDELKKRIDESGLGKGYHYYGTGDIGGSPTMNSVDAVTSSLNGNGPLRIVSATSDQIYKDYLPYENHPELPVYDGELLMDVHGTGCYTSQAAMKLYNRQNELLGDAAERAAVAAEMLGAAPYPGENLTTAWQRFIFHQFHDDLTGTSIPRAYEFSWNDELLSLSQFAAMTTAAVNAVASQLDTRAKGVPVVLYNPLGHERADLVEITLDAKSRPAGATVTDHNGRKVEAQITGFDNGKATLLVNATLPANGYAVYDVRLNGKAKDANLSSPASSLENSIWKIAFDSNGDITSLIDKRNNKQLVADGKAIRLALFTENKSYDWPAWEIIKATTDADPISITGNVKISQVENGPLRKTVKVEKSHDGSQFTQYISLHEGPLAERIDFLNEIDWQLTNSLLKAEFPLTVANSEATYDLGIGTVKRPNNTPTAYEVYAQRWADLTDASGNYGLTVMNDSKYGWDKPADNTLRLTLIHTPETARGYAYQNKQDFGHHRFTYSIAPHSGELNATEASTSADLLNQRVKAFAVTPHAGALGKSYSPLQVNNRNVAVKALKKAENSNEYVVRLFDTAGKGNQDVTLTFASPILAAAEADGTEKTIGNAKFNGNQLNLTVGANGIKTVKVKLETPETNRAANTGLTLPMNKKCFSWNEMRADADFESGYSYAAELIPATLNAGNVMFNLENQALLNGMECRGDTIYLPEGSTANRLYLLTAAATDGSDITADFKTGNLTQTVSIPSYTGFIGQWGHTGHTEGYLKNADVAYAGTHRHSSQGDHPYEFTYMFKVGIDIPKGTRSVILPDNPNAVIFAATLADEPYKNATPASTLFQTAIPGNATAPSGNLDSNKTNLLSANHIIGWSGFVNDSEHPRNLVDGDPTTKWCDTSGIPAYVDFDLGEPTEISSWKMVNAAIEHRSYITSSCLLQGRNTPDEEWRTIDYYTGNSRNIVAKNLPAPQTARYLRLSVIHPMQAPDAVPARVYELAVYK